MKVLNTGFYLFLAVLVVCFFSCAKIESNGNPNISVIGTSSVFVNPDTAFVSFSISTIDRQLENAKSQNDKIKKSVFEVFENYKISEKNISTNGLTVYPRYNYAQGYETFTGYEVNQNYTVRISELSSYESFITDLLNSGIKNIHNVNFTVENTRDFANTARSNALKAATEKAELLCATVSGKTPKLGKIIRISEVDSSSNNDFRALNMKETSSDVGGFENFGQIQVTAKLNVVFELKY